MCAGTEEEKGGPFHPRQCPRKVELGLPFYSYNKVLSTYCVQALFQGPGGQPQIAQGPGFMELTHCGESGNEYVHEQENTKKVDRGIKKIEGD